MQTIPSSPSSANEYATCCFTGHRKIPDEHIPLLYQLTDEAILGLYQKGTRHFRTGGAMGFDTLAALRLIRMKTTESLDLKLDLILPCRDQTKSWPQNAISEYQFIMEYADSVTYIAQYYTSTCMHARNRALVDGSDYCIAYLTENRGGTAYTVAEALKKQLTVINLGEYFLPLKSPTAL